MSRITTRSIRKSARARNVGGSASRIVVLPRPGKSWLLAGTALVTGVVVAGFGGSVLTATPAAADCSFVTVTPPADAPYEVVCGLDTGEVEYDAGPAPTLTSETTFDGDLRLTTDVNGFPTLIVSDWDGIDIDGTTGGSNGYDIEVIVNDMTAIIADTEGVQVRTNDDGEDLGNIDIKTYGFIQSGQDGVQTQAVDGETWIRNWGIIGVDFIDDLQIVYDAVNDRYFFANGVGTEVTLTPGSAFEIGNAGNVGGHGINSYADGIGEIWAYNYGMIFAEQDGVHAEANGGGIWVYNGFIPLMTPGGLIDAQENGVWAENSNGGNVYVTNGTAAEYWYGTTSNIFSGGEYGIYARSRADGTDDGDANVQVWNYGYIETWGDEADAGIYARTSADAGGFAGVYNGGELISLYEMNPNARITAYDFDIDSGVPDTADIDIEDANGIEVVKYGGFHTDGDGGQFFSFDQIFGEGYLADLELAFGDTYEELFGELPDGLTGLTFSTFTKNYGTWDFSGADHFLTPGFYGDGDEYGDSADALSVLDPAANTTGGVFAPGGSAWLARNYSNASTGLWNYGTMIGQGSSGDPVLDIQTVHDDQGANSNTVEDEFVDFDFPNIVYIYNAGYQEHTVYDEYFTPWTYATYGVIGSDATPHAWGFDPEYAFNTNFGFQAEGGVDWAFINDTLIDGGELARFGPAANDQLIDASGPDDNGAGMFLFNKGLLIGQIDVDSADGVGNIFLNTGTWITRGTSRFFGEEDILVNFGLVQASQIGEFNSDTEFRSLNETYNYGVFSLLDGGAGDELEFGGDYYGAGFDVVLEDFPAYFALDAYLASEDSGDADGDLFDIDGYLGGSTGLIVRNSNPDGSTGINQEGIDVVEYGDIGVADAIGCGASGGDDAVCRTGDTMYISSLSPRYFTADGVGMIEDGLYAWSLWHDGEWGDFELRSDWGPGAVNAPGVITGAQTIFYESDSVVADHIYGGQFAGSGGGGADLITDYPATDYAAPAASGGTRSALWVKGFGSWTDRDATVDVGFGPVDTSSDQDIYGILGGGDFKPGGPDSPVRIGLFGGYVTSSLDFDLGTDSSVDYEGGTLGGYAAYNNGGFYVDATVKGDLLDTTYKYSGTSVDADVTNIGVTANTGYRMNMGMSFIEPIASLAYVHTKVDDVTTPGGSVDFSNGDSLRAGAGGRIGANFGTGGGSTTEISLLGKVWNEFEGDNTVTVSDGINTETFTEDTSGIFGEVAAEAVVTSADGTLSGFVGGGGKFGDNFTSWNAKVGVRKGF